MKLKLLSTVLCLFTFMVYAQDKLVFNYDTSGNQTLRDRICLNCSAVSIDAAKDSLPAVIEDVTSKNLSKDRFLAAPNPVTDILNVEWIYHAKNPVKQITLFGNGNRLLSTLDISDEMNSTEFNFGSYPSGFYLLLVNFADGSTESYKIIKK
ncbi:T9SS type A sorting domain-containing protein [Ascidiimonas sp. W6]|uniref:T9SS type A sorting domain-containing protein n=1 Tax=Ascidiimonas meishanensis TaxID=3128903 RepID=UPI0030ECA5B5